MEGSGVGSAWCSGYVDVHAGRVSYVVGGCNLITTEHGRYSLLCMHACRTCEVHEQCWSLYGVLECELCCELLLLLNMADMHGLPCMWKAVE